MESLSETMEKEKPWYLITIFVNKVATKLAVNKMGREPICAALDNQQLLR